MAGLSRQQLQFRRSPDSSESRLAKLPQSVRLRRKPAKTLHGFRVFALLEIGDKNRIRNPAIDFLASLAQLGRRREITVLFRDL